MNQYENFPRNGPGMCRRRYHAWILAVIYHTTSMAGKNGKTNLRKVPSNDSDPMVEEFVIRFLVARENGIQMLCAGMRSFIQRSGFGHSSQMRRLARAAAHVQYNSKRAKWDVRQILPQVGSEAAGVISGPRRKFITCV
jgi:hypothetical protein